MSQLTSINQQELLKIEKAIQHWVEREYDLRQWLLQNSDKNPNWHQNLSDWRHSQIKVKQLKDRRDRKPCAIKEEYHISESIKNKQIKTNN